MPVFAGLAMSFRIRGESRVAMTWVGDGARWTAEFHEGMNLAAVQRAPLVVVLQDNQVALGTKGEAHSRAGCDAMAAGYGVDGLTCDGMNVLDVHAASTEAVARCRRGDGPVILTAVSFRMGGHATHDEAEARALFPADVFAHWGRRDPIGMYETWLVETRGIPPGTLERIENQVIDEMDRAAEAALASRATQAVTEADVNVGVYGVEARGARVGEA
jgi:TPP-dependent pyruvate/acetoin dehydrogenase alpha subunit